MSNVPRSKKELNQEKKKEVLLTLLERADKSNNQKINFSAISRELNCCRRAVSKIWKDYGKEFKNCGSTESKTHDKNF